MHKVKNIYTIDFETRNSDIDLANKETSVWLWDICSCDTFKHRYGTSLDDLFQYVFDEIKEDVIYYFHNLKFDGSFLISYLLTHGYTWTDKQFKEIQPYYFNSLIDSRKQFFSITIRNKNNAKIEIRDSQKKIASSVAEIAESWNLPILKGEIDYKKHRPLGYIPTDEEINYINHDTEIMARVLKEFHQEGMSSLTVASDSFKSYKKTMTKKTFAELFPVLDKETDDYIRKSYLGGLCIVNKKYKNILLSNCKCYDKNSMYPSKMQKELFAYGVPVKGEGRYEENKKYPVYIQHVKCQIKLKDNHIPCLMLKRFLQLKNEYIEDTGDEIIELYLTMVDMKLLYDAYDILYIEFIDYLMFRGSTKLFTEFIDTNYLLKQNSEGAKRLLAKLRLNSFYGKWATNPVHYTIEPYLDDTGILCFKSINKTIDDPIYTINASLTTAYSRYDLYSNIQNNYDNFVYCDTDSIITVGDAVGLEIDKKKLGAWDLEKEYKLFKVIAQKTYYGVLKDDSVLIKVCGAPNEVKKQINLDNFKIGETFTGKLRPVRVKGGLILVDTTFTFKDR